MPSATVTALAVAFMVWRVVQQQRGRPLGDLRRRKWFWLLCALAASSVLAGLATTSASTRLAATAAVAGICAIAVGAGALRGRTVRVWRSASGQVMRQGTAATTVAWLVWCAVHLVLDRGLGLLVADPALSATTLYAGLVLSLAAQAAVLSRRSTHTPIRAA